MMSEIAVFWDTMMCTVIGASPFQLNLQPPSEPLVPVYQTTQYHIPQKHYINIQ
jgi:hypothetical protein